MTLRNLATIGCLAFPCLFGCKETVSSEHIRTGGIAMLTTVTAHSASDTTVHTELRVGGDESNTYVVLKNGDRLVAEADADERTMRAITTGVYEADFRTGEGGTRFTVGLERDEDLPASDNFGSLPEPFEITTVVGRAPISRSQDSLEITWEPSGEGDDMHIRFAEEPGGSCLRFDEDEDIAGDPGSYTLEPDFLESSATDEENPETCDVEVTLTRSRRGTSDSVLDGESRFVLEQVRRFSFVSAP
jgi:hypothetical protein